MSQSNVKQLHAKVGAAWPFKYQNGKTGLNIRLNIDSDAVREMLEDHNGEFTLWENDISWVRQGGKTAAGNHKRPRFQVTIPTDLDKRAIQAYNRRVRDERQAA